MSVAVGNICRARLISRRPYYLSFSIVLSPGPIYTYTSGPSGRLDACPVVAGAAPIRFQFMFQHIRLAIGLCAASAALASLPARAEVFILKSGGRIEGEHLNPNRERGQPYHLRTGEGVQLYLADSTVQRVIVKTDLDKQYETLLAKTDNSVEGQWGLAEWCKEAGLTEQRKRHLQAVISLAPDHAEARKALGYQRYGSRWLTHEEHLQSLGYSKYKGAWRLQQEIEIDNRLAQQELLSKKLRKDIFRWFEQVANSGRYADAAERELNAIHDPEAAGALAEILGDPQQPRSSRQRSLAILAKL